MSVAVAGGLATALALGWWATRTPPKKKRKKDTNGVVPPAVAIYEFGDIVIAIWKKGTDYKWGLLFDIDILDVKASRDAKGKWTVPVPILRYEGSETTLAKAKDAAQAQANDLEVVVVDPLIEVFDYKSSVVAIWGSTRDAERPIEWALFPEGTIDGVVSSRIGERWAPPDGLDVSASGRSADLATAQTEAKAAADAIGKEGSVVVQPPLSPPQMPVAVVKFFGANDPSRLPRMPGADEAIASADCGTIGVGPLFWDRAGNLVGWMLHKGITSTVEIRDAVLKQFLPGCWDRKGPGIDDLRKAIVDSVRNAKQAGPQQPQNP